jgi:hypothetical protein
MRKLSEFLSLGEVKGVGLQERNSFCDDMWETFQMCG